MLCFNKLLLCEQCKAISAYFGIIDIAKAEIGVVWLDK